MDVFGLVLAIPAVVAANLVYVLIVRFGLSSWTMLTRWLLWPSYGVLAVLVLDVLLVLTIGAVATRTLIGPWFWSFHLVAFLLGAPSLANVLVLSRGLWFRNWYATVVLCGLFGVFLVFFQVGVGGALYGPDGVGGPFSS
jgi:hypothetical protein